MAQKQILTGVVTDSETNEILIGAIVLEKGTSNGIATDADGQFSISVDPQATLEFRYLSYKTKTIKLSGQTVLSIALVNESTILDEYVVVGYGTQKKVNMTGSVGVVKVDERLSSRSVSNVSSALSGLVPGLSVQQSTGMAGANSSNLLIRGLGTVNNANPLVVVDGMPDVDMNRIDMNDISSISVLKDASSSAIYGSRAANGVILITTKTGQNKEKVNIDYSGTFAYTKPTQFYDMLQDYPRALTLHQRASRAGRISPTFYDGTIEEWMSMSMIDPLRYPNENQLDWVTRDGFLKTHNVSASGAGEKHNFYISVGALDERGFMINNDYDKYNFRANTDYKIRKDIRVGLRLDGQWTDMTYAYANGFVDNDAKDYYLPLSIAIAGLRPYDYETGRYGGVMAFGEANNAANMYADYSSRNNKRERQEFNGNVYAEYEPIAGLTARVDFSLRYYNQFQKSYLAPTGMKLYNFQTDEPTQTFIEESANISNSSKQGRKMLTQFKLQYDKQIAKNHHINVMGVYAEEYWNDKWFSASRNDRIHSNITEIDGALRTTQGTGGASDAEGLRSYLGRLNYSAWDRYLLEFTFRLDGSSKFLKGHRYGFFPSGSFAWRFSEEPFFEDFKKYLYSGKLRVSYGTLGNNSGVKRYEQKDTMITTPYALNGNTLVQGFSVYKMINRDFSWEETTVANVGLDLGFFNNQLTLEVDYYNRLTKGMIRPSELSTVLYGYSAPRVNIGNLRNQGIEFNIGWQDTIDKLNYGVSFNASYNRDKLESWNDRTNPNNIFVGMPYQFNYYMQAWGIAQTWEDIYNAPIQNNNNISPGDIIYEDLNGDGQITGADKKAKPAVNEARPTGNFGLNLYAEWKGIDIAMLFQATTGRKDYWLETMNATHVGSDRYAFQEWHWNDSWSLDNRGAKLPRLATTNTGRNAEKSSYWLQNLDYMRMKNLQVGYNIPRSILKKATVEKCRVFLSAENLFTLTSWDGVDPEKPTSKDPFPLMRTLSFGINVGF